MRWRVVALVLALAGGATAAGQQGQRYGGFPHQRHARLFPTGCNACHSGVAVGDTATSLPDTAICARCHNGTDEPTVPWRKAWPTSDILEFSHVRHLQHADSASRACASCHSGGSGALNLVPAAPPACFSCHAHQATSHFAEDNRCTTCHAVLTSAPRLTTERIAALPKPASHERPDFGVAHAPATAQGGATCAICHARESCARCHVNAASVPLIASLQPDPRVAALAATRVAVYPTPVDHGLDRFPTTHGDLARANPTRCGTCHARTSCTTCHIGPGASDAIALLPVARPGGAPGVTLEYRQGAQRLKPPMDPVVLRALGDTSARKTPVRATVRVHELGFRTAHGTQAAVGALTCSGCHEQKFCSDCHAGEGKRRFHPANFVAGHAADAFARDNDCSSCHNTETFCRACHQQAGLASSGRLDAAFHNGQPLWLLQHGRAARQGLQNCVSCHKQKDCLTCHSTLGWGVNPHGRNFDADRMAKQAGPMCLLCHLKIPTSGGTN